MVCGQKGDTVVSCCCCPLRATPRTACTEGHTHKSTCAQLWWGTLKASQSGWKGVRELRERSLDMSTEIPVLECYEVTGCTLTNKPAWEHNKHSVMRDWVREVTRKFLFTCLLFVFERISSKKVWTKKPKENDMHDHFLSIWPDTGQRHLTKCNICLMCEWKIGAAT